MLKDIDIEYAYRLYLDRPVESQYALERLLSSAKSTSDLRNKIMMSDEFRRKNPALVRPAVINDHPPMSVENTEPSELPFLLKHIEETWQSLGEVEPHWSVLSGERFKKENLFEHKNAYYASGEKETDIIKQTFQRNHIDISELNSCLEYGCGLGRVTTWLAEDFDIVYGYDISESHLKLAQEYIDERQFHNIVLARVQSFNALKSLPLVDFIYSIIVLQHNPPPVMAAILEDLLNALNKNGIAMIQLPTYRKNYSFNIYDYKKSISEKNKDIEMHLLPQSDVFRIINNSNCQILEVVQDNYVGLGTGIISNTFLVKKVSR